MAPQKIVNSPTMRHLLQLKIVGENRVAADVGEHRQRTGGNQRAADGESVKPVRQVDGVGGAHQHEDHKDDERQKRERPQMRIDRPAKYHQVRDGIA